MKGLRDIKDIVEDHDNCLLMLIFLIAGIVMLFVMAVYIYRHRRVRRKKPAPKELALQNLKNIDYDNAKEAAYTFSVDGYLWVDEENAKEFESIEKELLPYKYKKDTPQLDTAVKERMQRFIKELK